MAVWRLLKIWHTEALESVADRPDAHRFERHSFVVAPAGWGDFAEDELERRVVMLLEAAYRKRNHSLRGSDDPTGMVLLGYDFEWATDDEIATRPWSDAFHAFRISDDGRDWHIVPVQEVAATFDERLAPHPPPAE